MPCDAIAVMSLQFGADNALLASKKDGLQAVVTLLNQLGHVASLKSGNVMVVDNYRITLNEQGELVASNIPQKLLCQVRDCCDAIAGALTQQKVAGQVAKTSRVLSQTTTSDGSIVMKVVMKA